MLQWDDLRDRISNDKFGKKDRQEHDNSNGSDHNLGKTFVHGTRGYVPERIPSVGKHAYA